MPAPRAILFDLDDTILDFTGPAEPAWVETVNQYADRYDGHSAAEVRATIDRVSRAWWADPERHRLGRLDLSATRARNVADALAELGIHDEDLAQRMADTFATLRTDGLRLFPGAWRTLEHFRDAGTSMALVTNGDSVGQRYKIDRFDLESFFDCIVIEEEFGVGKPDDSVFHHALSSLDSEPQHAWMVGDNHQWEIAPCRRLGLHTVWVDAHDEGLHPEADVEPHRIVRAIDELIEN